MVGISFAIGNFMKRSDYDPNLDNKIAAAQLYWCEGAGTKVDYYDCTDKELDMVATPDACTGTVYENVGTPYTIALADMDDKTNDIKVTIACEIKSSHSAHACVAAYNIDGGADQEIGTKNGTVWTAKSVTLVEVAVGQVIQFRLKEAGSAGDIQNMSVTETHAARKDYQVLAYY